ncbi:MAG: phosphatidylglycerophosphatase A [Patescibacteria group bacterium]
MKRFQNTWNWLALCLATTFFVGFAPGKVRGKPGSMGGTAGAFVALTAQIWLIGYQGWFIPSVITIASFLVGILVIGTAERFLFLTTGPRMRHTGEMVISDFNETCIDEFHGQFLAGLPVWLMAGTQGTKVVALLVSFLVFRIVDSQKPWPVNAVEKHFSGTSFGIMIDDTVAALPACAATAAILKIAS